MSKPSEYEKLLQDKDLKAWHSNLAQGSKITADVYLRRLGSFCTRNSTTPKGLIEIQPKQIQNLLISLVSEMKKEGKAGSYIHSNVKAIKSWLSFNDIEIKNKIRIEGASDTPTLKNERVPTKEELKRIFNAANLQQRVACGMLAHAGLRPESLGDYEGDDGLKVSDFVEIEIRPRKKEVQFKKLPARFIIRKNLSKAGHEYFGFLTFEVAQYLKEYLESRMRDGEELRPDSPILTPKKDSHTKKALDSHITSTNVGDMIRSAIRKAGFDMRPYVLRAYFDSQLLIAESKGNITKDYRAFFMGHKGDIEARYTVNKSQLPEEMIEDMRASFKRSVSFLQTQRNADEANDRKTQREDLLVAVLPNISKAEMDKLNLGEMTQEEFQLDPLESWNYV
ncbi:MAG: site-specific integrase, partial [Thaumarchaeota archaeon]|nr:site-specific integrase [Nitrososphaerota archaeon]